MRLEDTSVTRHNFPIMSTGFHYLVRRSCRASHGMSCSLPKSQNVYHSNRNGTCSWNIQILGIYRVVSKGTDRHRYCYQFLYNFPLNLHFFLWCSCSLQGEKLHTIFLALNMTGHKHNLFVIIKSEILNLLCGLPAYMKIIFTYLPDVLTRLHHMEYNRMSIRTMVIAIATANLSSNWKICSNTPKSFGIFWLTT